MLNSSGEIRFRPVCLADAAALARLMGVLGYPTSKEQMQARLESIIAHRDYLGR